MRIDNLKNMKNGWFIGKFKPSFFESDVEIGYKYHKAGEKINTHYHRCGIEITLITKGSEIINGIKFVKGDMFLIEPYEVAEIEILEDLEAVVFKETTNVYDKVDIKEIK